MQQIHQQSKYLREGVQGQIVWCWQCLTSTKFGGIFNIYSC